MSRLPDSVIYGRSLSHPSPAYLRFSPSNLATLSSRHQITLSRIMRREQPVGSMEGVLKSLSVTSIGFRSVSSTFQVTHSFFIKRCLPKLCARLVCAPSLSPVMLHTLTHTHHHLSYQLVQSIVPATFHSLSGIFLYRHLRPFVPITNVCVCVVVRPLFRPLTLP